MKKLVFFSFLTFLIFSCNKDELVPVSGGLNDQAIEFRGQKVDVCHNGNVINISINALPAHLAHGDGVDMDGDGYFNLDNDCGPTDCDDANAAINPGAEEIANNEVDEDCDGVALVIDEDNDGYNSDEDCDDSNASVHPDAEEICGNGVDEDCDGEDFTACDLSVKVRLHCYSTSYVMDTYNGPGTFTIPYPINYNASYITLGADVTSVTLVRRTDNYTTTITSDANLCNIGFNDNLKAIIIN